MSAAVLLAFAAGAVAAAGICDLAAAPATQPRRRRARRARARAALMALGRRVGAPPPARDLPARLQAADVSLSPADATAIKAGAALASLLAALPLATGAPGRLGPLLPVAAAAGGFIALDLALAARIRRRAHAMTVELPDVLDLLRVAMQAGLPPMRALGEVGRRHSGVLAAELERTAARAGMGEAGAEALAQLERRAPAGGVVTLTAVLRRADRLGTPPAEALGALARDAREARARARAEAAARAAPKIQLIVALLLVPSVMALVAAALVPALMDSL